MAPQENQDKRHNQENFFEQLSDRDKESLSQDLGGDMAADQELSEHLNQDTRLPNEEAFGDDANAASDQGFRERLGDTDETSRSLEEDALVEEPDSDLDYDTSPLEADEETFRDRQSEL